MVRTAGVVGGGTMGTGIAMALANAAIPVALLDSSGEQLERARVTIERTYRTALEKGRLTRELHDARLATITLTSHYAAFAAADLVIEAVFEQLAVKRVVFEQLSASCRADAIVATNTSYLDIDAIATAVRHPERFLGLHFFSPAHVMKLLEIVRGRATSPQTISAACSLAERLGKVGVVVGNCDGFVGNRMLLRYKREAEMLLEEGASPQQVDRALTDFGFAMGPFAVSDLAGLDIGYASKHERIARGDALPFRLSNISDRLVERKRLGQKTGAGYYRYTDGDRTPQPDLAVDVIIAAERTRLGLAPRAIYDREIVERCVFALVNEGAKVLADRIVERGADIDTVWLYGYGFPKIMGGPMQYADSLGLDYVVREIEQLQTRDPAFWQPAKLLKDRAAAGRRLVEE